jgi:hypothetical protein
MIVTNVRLASVLFDVVVDYLVLLTNVRRRRTCACSTMSNDDHPIVDVVRRSIA